MGSYFPNQELNLNPWEVPLPAKTLQSCPNSLQPYDCSPPGFSVHGILQARILEWVAMPSFRLSSRPRNWTHISVSPALAGGFFTTSVPRQPYKSYGRKAEERRLSLNPRLPGMEDLGGSALPAIHRFLSGPGLLERMQEYPVTFFSDVSNTQSVFISLGCHNKTW